MKRLRSVARIVLVAALTAVIFLLFYQSRMIYFPRPYDKSAPWDLAKRGGKTVEIQTAQGKQVAFYLPPRDSSLQEPGFVWMVFGGNGSLALDYAGEPLNWDARFGYLFVDYPGYGLSEGKASPEALKESIVSLSAECQKTLGWNAETWQKKVGVLGHSLGCAAALIAADEIKLQKVILCAPFTSLTDMGRHLLGWPLCFLNMHRFDNVARLQSLAPRGAEVAIFHGVEDEVIPVVMGRSLGEKFPKMVTFTAMPGCDHNSIVMWASQDIGEAMLKMSSFTAKE